MKKLIKPAFVILFCLQLFSACQIGQENSLTSDKDYAVYLNENLQSPNRLVVESEIEFWSKRLRQSPDDMVSQIKLAGLYSKHFAYTGNIKEIALSDSFYKKANELQHHFSSGLYRALATNAITKHQFRQAGEYIDSSLQLGDDKRITQLQQFDVALELGDRLLAQQILNSIADRNSFEYLIRSARFLDHYKGDLNSAIKNLEKALAKARESDNKNLVQWTLINLGDLYSHANRFNEAYNSYLEALKNDPGAYHALKGIAWLAFSHDKNTDQAIRITRFLQKQHTVPDYYLQMAEIEKFKKNTALKNDYLQKFIAESTRPCYGGMYNKYLFSIYADELNDYKSAMSIALKEVNNRPTPESYDLLAYALYKNGKIEESKIVAEKYVKGKCFEPSVKYHLGIIAESSGNLTEAREYYEEALVSAFELGPATAEELSEKLKAYK